MADSTGVAPVQAEENQVKEDSGLVSFGDIAEAAGVESSFFESASPEPEEPTEVEETEEVEEIEDTEEPQAAELSEVEEPQEPPAEESDGVKKRIGKLIEARNKAEAETEELKAKIAELESSSDSQPAPDPKGMDRFEGIKDHKELQARETEAEHLREWLLENPDGGEYTDITGAEHDVDYEQARKLMVETDRDLRKNIPLAAQRLQQREKNRQAAMQTFDWMKDKSSQEMQEVQQVLNSNQFIKDYYERDPYGVLTVAYAIEGIKAINAKKSQQTTKQAVAPKAPVPSRATSVTRKKTTNKKSLLQQAASGQVEDASAYIESLL
jgi:hypothetical protein